MAETKEFDPDWLRDEVVWGDYVEKNIVDQGRWMTYFDIVFEHEGKFWLINYGRGSTEMQEEDEWEYQGYETITATRVVPVEVTTIEYRPY